MTDVRLTALNPEDSQVYPVACNSSGELLVDKGETVEYVKVAGDNMTGDLTLGTNKILLDAGAGSINLAAQATESINVTQVGTPVYRVTSSGSTYIGNPAGTGGLGPSNSKVALNADGSATFAGDATVGDVNTVTGAGNGVVLTNTGYISSWPALADNSNAFAVIPRDIGTTTASIRADGSASFAGDVVIGSRNKQWMLVEQGGLCHMVEQVRATTADLLVDPASAEYPELRDVFQELNTIERCLEEVMTKLRMTQPDGWPVWDGSDNSR
jgi:hypothetical protein